MRLSTALAVCVLCGLGVTATGLLPAAAVLPREARALQADVLVIGGTPAGVAAALAASRDGARTVLVEAREELGGVLTGAWLNTFDMNWGPNREHLTRGIFLEVYRKLGHSFDVVQARNVLHRLTDSQPNLTVLLNTRVVYPVIREGQIVGVEVVGRAGRAFLVMARIVIDATDDADIAAATGVPYTLGRADTGLDARMQAATLIFRLDHVNKTTVFRYLRTTEQPHQTGGAWRRSAWGYRSIMARYRPRHPRTGIYDLNLGWQRDGTVLVNALHIQDVNGLEARSRREARAIALAELPGILALLHRRAPGFEEATLSGTAPYLYVRETRHIVGLYRMTQEDIMERRDFWDRVAIANYPIDIHPVVGGQLNPMAPIRYAYAIPFRALIPIGVENLLVVGRSMSATHVAAGSLRVVPTTMSLGEAAGVAAAMGVRTGMSPSQMARDGVMVAKLQKRLIAAGAYLPSPQTLAAQSSPSSRVPHR